MSEAISELYAEIAQWAVAYDPDMAPEGTVGLWRGKTPDWIVELNRNRDQPEYDGLRFACVRLRHKRLVMFGILSPYEGTIVGGSENTEDDMIAHFREQREQMEQAA